MNKDDAINRIEAASLSPALYRTARRILDRVHTDNGYLRLEYADMRAIVETDSDETVRGHLSRLSAAGLLTVRRNAAIHIYWHGADEPQPALLTAPEPETGRADFTRKTRENHADSARISRDCRADFTQKRADFTRNPRGFHASTDEPVYIYPLTTIVVNDNNNNNTSSSSSQPAAPAVEVSAPSAPTTAPAPTTPAPAQATGDHHDWQRVRGAYEQNIGLLTPILLPAVKAAINDYGGDMVILAIERAVHAEKRRWNYVEGILRNWAAEGFNAGTGAGRSKATTVGGSAASRGAGQPGGAVGGGPVGAARRQAEADSEPEGWGDFLRQRGLVPAGA